MTRQNLTAADLQAIFAREAEGQQLPPWVIRANQEMVSMVADGELIAYLENGVVRLQLPAGQ